MRYTSEELKGFAAQRERAAKLKKEIQELIYPNREYICYFMEYYPQWDNQPDKFKIRDTWGGRGANEEVIKMMEYIVKVLKEKQKVK